MELDYADVRKNLALVNLQAKLDANFRAYPGDGPSENLEVIKHVELFRCAQAKEDAIRMADQGNFDGSRQLLQERLDNIHAMGDAADSELTAEILELQEGLSFMVAPEYNKASRKKMAYNAYRQKGGRSRR